MANLTYTSGILAIPGLISGADDAPAAAILEGDALDDAHVAAACHQHQNRKRLAKNFPPLVTQEELVASRRRKHVVTAFNFDGPIPAYWGHQLGAAIQQTGVGMELLDQRMTQNMHQLMDRIDQMNQTQHQTNQTIETMQQTIVANQQQLLQTIAANQQQTHQNSAANQHQTHQDFAALQKQLQDTNQTIATNQQHMERRIQQESQRAMNHARHRPTDRIVPLIRLLDARNPTNGPDNLWFPMNQLELMTAPLDRVNPLLEFYSLAAAADEEGIMETRERVAAFLGVIN